MGAGEQQQDVAAPLPGTPSYFETLPLPALQRSTWRSSSSAWSTGGRPTLRGSPWLPRVGRCLAWAAASRYPSLAGAKLCSP